MMVVGEREDWTEIVFDPRVNPALDDPSTERSLLA
jgi:hypothetical protein